MSAPIDLRKCRPEEYAGKEIFEIKPVILGGSPTDPANKAVLTRVQHIEAVRYWNRVIQQARRSRADKVGT
jgi:hypothetical protein